MYGAGIARSLTEASMPKERIDGQESEFTEEDRQREQFGRRDVPGKADPSKMTLQRDKKPPKDIEPDHTNAATASVSIS
jgi:hypothetical protein